MQLQRDVNSIRWLGAIDVETLKLRGRALLMCSAIGAASAEQLTADSYCPLSTWNLYQLTTLGLPFFWLVFGFFAITQNVRENL